MPTIDTAFVEAQAPNAAAVKNGRALVLQRKLSDLQQTHDGQVLFGLCAGSGKSPYTPSADFADDAKPVYRCNCPSRQFPCKHVLALLFARADGQAFKAGELPAELAEKRDKAAGRAEKREAVATQPKKVNTAALAKKIRTQLDGLDTLEQLVHDLVRTGLGNLTQQTVDHVDALAKQLGDTYLPGAQSALRDLIALVYDPRERQLRAAAEQDKAFTDALDQLTRLQALVDRGRAYLQARLDDPALAPETDSDIAAQLGHAWQLAELKAAGCVRETRELIQLAFNSYDDPGRREFIDEGVWLDLDEGGVYRTLNYRPYKAVKYIKEDDSVFAIAQVPELMVYPGDLNPRTRWDGATQRPVSGEDIQRLRSHAHQRLADLLKLVRNQLRSPLADKAPLALLHVARIGTVDGQLVLEDGNGERLKLADVGDREPPSCHMLGLLSSAERSDCVLLLRFHQDLDDRTLRAKPISLITERIVRLTF